MPIRLGRFEMPKTLVKNEKTATETYAQFVAEPFEAGYGHTIGNSLRRTLLSSLEGAAITSVKIEGAPHEFTSMPGVVEDVVEIILNLKKVKFKAHDHEPRNLTLSVNKQGAITAGDITSTAQCEVLNPDQHICTLDKKMKFEAEFTVRVGRGFATGDENKGVDKPIGVIAIDSIFSPVTKVKYAVEQTRVGQRTDYDKLILDIWTDGRLTPEEALLQSAAILRHHLDVFVNFDDNQVEFDETPVEVSQENSRPQERGRDAQVPQLRQEVSERDQGQAGPVGPRSRNEVRARSCGKPRPCRRIRRLGITDTPCVTVKKPSSSAAARHTVIRFLRIRSAA